MSEGQCMTRDISRQRAVCKYIGVYREDLFAVQIKTSLIVQSCKYL